MSFVRSASNGVRRQQPVARGRHHHGIEHDMFWRPARQPRGDGVDGRKLRHHPDLDRVDVEIAENRIELRGHEIGGHLMDAADAARVLRGQGRDDGGAVDAERGKGLEVGLDAGAAGRIRAGDGERDRRRHRLARSNLGDPIRVISLP